MDEEERLTHKAGELAGLSRVDNSSNCIVTPASFPLDPSVKRTLDNAFRGEDRQDFGKLQAKGAGVSRGG